MKGTPDSASIIWAVILLRTWHKNCLNSVLSVLLAVPSRWHQTHRGAELPGWASGKCSHDILFEDRCCQLSKAVFPLSHRLLWVNMPSMCLMDVEPQQAGEQKHHSFYDIFEFVMLVWTPVFYHILWMYVNTQERPRLHRGNRRFTYLETSQCLFHWFVVNPTRVHNLMFQYIQIYYIFFCSTHLQIKLKETNCIIWSCCLY